MVLRVAVAGATSPSIGEHICRALVRRRGEFTVLLLVRSAALVSFAAYSTTTDYLVHMYMLLKR